MNLGGQCDSREERDPSAVCRPGHHPTRDWSSGDGRTAGGPMEHGYTGESSGAGGC